MKTLFLFEDSRTCYTLSLWRDEAAIVNFNTRVHAHIAAANWAFRDLQFDGLHSVQESDVLKAFRENRVGISKEVVYDPVKARGAIRVIKDLAQANPHEPRWRVALRTRVNDASQTQPPRDLLPKPRRVDED